MVLWKSNEGWGEERKINAKWILYTSTLHQTQQFFYGTIWFLRGSAHKGKLQRKQSWKNASIRVWCTWFLDLLTSQYDVIAIFVHCTSIPSPEEPIICKWFLCYLDNDHNVINDFFWSSSEFDCCHLHMYVFHFPFFNQNACTPHTRWTMGDARACVGVCIAFYRKVVLNLSSQKLPREVSNIPWTMKGF